MTLLQTLVAVFLLWEIWKLIRIKDIASMKNVLQDWTVRIAYQPPGFVMRTMYEQRLTRMDVPVPGEIIVIIVEQPPIFFLLTSLVEIIWLGVGLSLLFTEFMLMSAMTLIASTIVMAIISNTSMRRRLFVWLLSSNICFVIIVMSYFLFASIRNGI